MKVVDLKALAIERGLRGYSKLKKAELITFLQNNLRPRIRPTCTKPPKPTRPPPPPPTWEPRPLVRSRQNLVPGSRDMDIFEQEMCKNIPQLMSKFNDWYDWLVNHVPKTIKDKASRAFKTFKDKVVGLYDRLKPTSPRQPKLRPYQLRGKETFIEPPMEQSPSNQKHIKRMKKKLGKLNKKIRHSKRKNNNSISKQNSIKKKIKELKGSQEMHEPEESFNPVECEQAFNRAYRCYRINGRSRMDIDTFFDRIRQNLIDLMNRELGSARVQMTTWSDSERP